MMPSMSAICLAKLNVQSSPSTFTWVWIPVFMMPMGLEISDEHTQAQPQRIVMRCFPPKGILWAKNSPRNMSIHAGIVKQGHHYTNLSGYPSLNPFLLVNPCKEPNGLGAFYHLLFWKCLAVHPQLNILNEINLSNYTLKKSPPSWSRTRGWILPWLARNPTSGARVETMDFQFYRHTQNITGLKRTFKATSWTEITSDTCEAVLKNYVSLKSEGRRVIKQNST